MSRVHRFVLPVPLCLGLLFLGLLCLGMPCLGLGASVAAAEVEEHTFESDGVDIRYVTAGQGQPVVLVHGFSASAAANWGLNGIIDRLARNFWVIALDARGHGGSGKPHGPDAYGVQMVQDVLNLLDHLELDKAHVVGYSMGGFITTKLLSLAPDRLYSAVTGGAGWSRPGDDSSLTEALADSLEAGTGMTPLLEALTPEGETMAPEAMEQINATVLANNDPLALAAVARGLKELTVQRELLEANEIPVLAVVGAKDPLEAGVEAFDGVLANLEVVVVDDADHMSLLMNPAYAQQLADAIENFLLRTCDCA